MSMNNDDGKVCVQVRIRMEGTVDVYMTSDQAAELQRSFFDEMNDWARKEGFAGLGYVTRKAGEFGGPIAAPSANPSGRITATTARHVREGLDGRIAAILDGGPCPLGLESTIVGFAEGRPTVLRKGGISLERLRAVVPGLQVAAVSSSRPCTRPAPLWSLLTSVISTRPSPSVRSRGWAICASFVRNKLQVFS